MTKEKSHEDLIWDKWMDLHSVALRKAFAKVSFDEMYWDGSRVFSNGSAMLSWQKRQREQQQQ